MPQLHRDRKRCQTFCIRISLLASLVTILLGTMGLVMFRLPSQFVEMASSDMKLVDTVSTVWCGGQEFESNHKFSLYKVNDFPDTNITNAPIEIDLNFILPPRTFRDIRYYLLPESTLTVMSMSDHAAAKIFLLQGEENLRRCKEHEKRLAAGRRKTADDSSSEEDDSDEFFDDISYLCSSAIEGSDIPKGIINTTFHKSNSFVKLGKHVTTADLYSILLVNLNASHEVNIRVKITLYRAFYNVKADDVVCSSQLHCVHHVNFGSHEKLILYVGVEPSAGLEVFEIKTTCRPRVFFYALLFILIPVLFLVFLGGVIRAFSAFIRLPYDESKYLRVRVNHEVRQSSSEVRSEDTPITSTTSTSAANPPRTPPPTYSEVMKAAARKDHVKQLRPAQSSRITSIEECSEESLPPSYGVVVTTMNKT